MKKLLFKIQDYIDYYRMCIAAWIYPEFYDNTKKYKVLLSDIKSMEEIMKEIPEVKQSMNWLLGKNSNDAKYLAYSKYRSMSHFRDVLVNDYKRKLK